jgi:hypothetical protein
VSISTWYNTSHTKERRDVHVEPVKRKEEGDKPEDKLIVRRPSLFLYKHGYLSGRGLRYLIRPQTGKLRSVRVAKE